MPAIAENISAVVEKLSEALDSAREAQAAYGDHHPYLPKLIHAAKLSLQVDVLITEIEATARKQSKRLYLEEKEGEGDGD
jgi:hypothetical protein